MTESWSNWSSSVSCRPQTLALPASEAELQAIVAQAAARGQGVRVVGSGHSFTPLCATDDVLISLDQLAGVASIDSQAHEATIWAGTKIHDLGDPLWEAGLALANQGDVDVQSLAGAISTGTHGTGPTLGNLSTQAIGFRLVTASGEILEIGEHFDPELLRAARVSLGSLGVLSAVRLRLVPAYSLCERQWQLPIDECLEQLDERIAAHRHFEFFWYSTTDLAHMKALQPVLQAVDSAPQDDTRIDRSYRIFPTVRSNRFNEMEYAIPAAAGPACFGELRRLMRDHYPEIQWPVEYRTLAADDSWLSAAYERPTVTLSIHQGAALPYADFFRDAEAIFRAYQGRPHWAKLHNLRTSDLRALWPCWDRFHSIRRRLDPGGIFLNDYLRRIFDGSES